MPILFIIVILFTIWLSFEVRKVKKIETKSSEDFWKRELDANYTRPQDISSLVYIHVPLETLPFSENTNEDILQVQDTIKSLTNKKLLNLTGISNTDLKLKYGAKNLDLLMTCDQNFTLFVRSLNKWAHLLYEAGSIAESQQVLEYAVSCKSDISSTYFLLAKIYKEENTPEKIKLLIVQAEELNTLMKTSILQTLNQYL